MHDRRDRSHDTRERLRGGGKAEAESAELPDFLSHTEPQKTARFPVNPPDAETGRPTVESPCGSETQTDRLRRERSITGR